MANDELPPEIPAQFPVGQGDTGTLETDNVVAFDQVEVEPDPDKPRNRRFHPGGAGVGEDSPAEGYDPDVLRQKIEAVSDDADTDPSVWVQTGYTGRPNVTPLKRSRPVPQARRPIEQVFARRESVVPATPDVVEATVTEIKTKLAAKGSPTAALEARHKAELAAKDLLENPRTPAPASPRGRPYIPHPSEKDKNEESEE